MKRQFSHTDIYPIARSRYLTSIFPATPNGFLVITTGFDKNGVLDTESAKNRGYKFVKYEPGIGSNKWIRVFETEAEAENEITAICE